MAVNVPNLASITGEVFVDVNQNGDSQIDTLEAALLAMANDLYSMINEQGDE